MEIGKVVSTITDSLSSSYIYNYITLYVFLIIFIKEKVHMLENDNIDDFSMKCC
jgi:hypothetical protein